MAAPVGRTDSGHQCQEVPLLVALEQSSFLILRAGNSSRSVLGGAPGKLNGLFLESWLEWTDALEVVLAFFFNKDPTEKERACESGSAFSRVECPFLSGHEVGCWR